jgi:hypothetical protein
MIGSVINIKEEEMSITMSGTQLDTRIDNFLQKKAKQFPDLRLEEHHEAPAVAGRQSVTWHRGFIS